MIKARQVPQADGLGVASNRAIKDERFSPNTSVITVYPGRNSRRKAYIPGWFVGTIESASAEDLTIRFVEEDRDELRRSESGYRSRRYGVDVRIEGLLTIPLAGTSPAPTPEQMVVVTYPLKRSPGSTYTRGTWVARIVHRKPGRIRLSLYYDHQHRQDELVWGEEGWDSVSHDVPVKVAVLLNALFDSGSRISARSAVGGGASEIGEEADELAYPEGAERYSLHRHRERSGAVPRKAKRIRWKQTGRLSCEVCGFDFEAFYGSIGRGFIEAHHTNPLSLATTTAMTGTKDLALVCANCHRILHRGGEALSVECLRTVVAHHKVKNKLP